MEHKCENCGALMFKEETLCAADMAKSLWKLLPTFIKEYISGNSPVSKHLLSYLRKYNGSFAMTSLGDKDASVEGCNSSFRIQGQAFHSISSLLPPPKVGHAKFIQVYFMDSVEEQLVARNHSSLKLNIIQNII